MSDHTKQIEGLEEIIENYQMWLHRLSSGEELCDHHYNGCDGCYECYCTGCDKHIREVRDMFDVPFKEDAYCFSCRPDQ